MSAEQGGLLKSRAEDFARHLRRRLKSLGEPDDGGGGWTEDSEVYYDIDSSLASPQEELPEPIFIAAQNRDNLPLQRSESSGSEYFDTVEELLQPSSTSPISAPFLKKIPIPHLKTETPFTLANGHTHVIDADLGCSRVHEINCEQDDPSISKSSDKPLDQICDVSVVDNNNTWREQQVEEVADKIGKLDLEVNTVHSNGDSVSLETLTNNFTSDSSVDLKDALGNTSCVFCGIEQVKSSLSNSSSTQLIFPQKDQRSSTSIDNSADKEPDKHLKDNLLPEVPLEPSTESLSDTDESVPLKDLLQVLKKEISKESIEIKASESNDINTIQEISQPSCPSIEIRESTPTKSTTEITEPQDKEDEFDIELKRKNFRRCSSLKSGKTPPGTPGRKKIVRFADVFGLDLADVKTFLDEVPTVPKSAYSDLHLQPDQDSTYTATPTITPTITIVTPHVQKLLVPLFQQPFLTPNFMDRVMANNVCLESAAVSDMSIFAITGVVRVRNIDFYKSVYIRYSINGWNSFSDLQARYVPNSCDGFSDKFSFVLYAHTLSVGQKLSFAIRYHTAGTQFWDSNGGLNYMFECIQQPVSQTFNNHGIPPSPIETWASFL